MIKMVFEDGPIRKRLREGRLLKGSPENVITPRELRGKIAAMVQAIETSTFRIKEHLRTGAPLNLDLIGSEFNTIERIASTTVKDVEKAKEFKG